MNFLLLYWSCKLNKHPTKGKSIDALTYCVWQKALLEKFKNYSCSKNMLTDLETLKTVINTRNKIHSRNFHLPRSISPILSANFPSHKLKQVIDLSNLCF